MANDFTIDPFTQIYDAIWDLLEANEEFTSLVKLGNRIRFDGSVRNPLKERVSNADFPEVILVMVGGEINQKFSSTSVQITKTFRVMVNSGTLKASVHLFPIEWAALKAIHAGMDTLNLSFVKRLRIGNVEYSLLDSRTENPSAKNSVIQWVGVLDLVVDMVIPITDMA